MKRLYTRFTLLAIVIILLTLHLYSCTGSGYVLAEVIYRAEYTVPPRTSVIIAIQLNQQDSVVGTLESLATCTVEFCIDVAGVVLDPNNRVVEIFRINYTKPLTRFSIKTLDAGVYRVILVNLISFEAYVRLTIERVSGIVATPPKVIIPTTTIYTTITTTTTVPIPTTILSTTTTTIEKTIAILISTTSTYTKTTTSTETITVTTTTTMYTKEVSTVYTKEVSYVEKTTTYIVTITTTITKVTEVEKEKTVTIAFPVTTTIQIPAPTPRGIPDIYILISFIAVLVIAVATVAVYILLKFLRRS
jgi:hypothetical protein